jgi:predicted enzyme related to lactoylglutathione lyase
MHSSPRRFAARFNTGTKAMIIRKLSQGFFDTEVRNKMTKVLIASVVILVSACSIHESKNMAQKPNPAMYFEIPVTDMKRAIAFYEKVFGFDFQLEEIHANQMALMPFELDGSGISGALAKGEIYKPTLDGTLIYLRAESIDNTLERAQLAGAKVLFPKTKAGEYSFVAEIEDSEGNRIGLMEPLP